MEPEEAFRLIDPRGVKHRAVAPGETFDDVDAEDKLDGAPAETPRWVRYTIVSTAAVLATGFVGILISGGYLLLNGKIAEPPILAIEEPLTVFSTDEIHSLIIDTISRFLQCTDTEGRLAFVCVPGSEKKAMADYYEGRGNRDAPLKAIHLIKPVLLDNHKIWIVDFTDVEGKRKSASLERIGNAFRLHWSPSYAYGELSWQTFASTKPSAPAAMRAFLSHHTGELPPGYSKQKHAAYVISDQHSSFTSLAIMEKTAEGQHDLSLSPRDARLPVHLELHYTQNRFGDPQLTIHRLLHFKWLNHSNFSKGSPSRRQNHKQGGLGTGRPG